VPELIPGYEHVRRGTAAYRGTLRQTPRGAPVWRCGCPAPHLNTITARRCAEQEMERRRQGGRQVLALLRCDPCERWYPDDPVPGVTLCPRCGVRLERLKVAVLERGPAT